MFVSLIIAATLQSTQTSEAVVPVAGLIGKSPAEVAVSLSAAPEPVPLEAVRIVRDGRTVDIYTARRFHRIAPQGALCVTGFPEVVDPDGPQPTLRQTLARVGDGYLVFEEGRLRSIHPTAPPPEIVTRASMRAMMQRPLPPSPFAVQPGRLPLSDDVAALARLPQAPDGLTFTSTCADLPERSAYRSDPGTDVIWGLVGLTLLPTVPFMRAEEARAEREGGALLASAEAGADLGMSAEDWVGRLRGVRTYRDPADPDFAVIAIKLGSGDDTSARVGLLGVRGTRVIWKTEREAADRIGLRSLMCRDEENRANVARPGCSSTGFLVP